MVKKRPIREKVTEEKEAEKKAAEKSKKVIRIKKINLKSLKPLKPYAVPVAVIIIAAFFILRGIIISHVAFGDKVKLSYSFELEDGTILDSGSDDFILGSISTEFGFISNKIDKIIKKMKLGEEKTIKLEPGDAFGERDMEKIDTINRTSEFNKIFTVGPEEGFNLTTFKEDFKKENDRYPQIGESLPYNQFWNVTIINMTDEKITLQHNLSEEDILPLEPRGNITIQLEKDKIILVFNPGKQLLVSYGVLANVIDVTNDKITLDYNPQFAGRIIIAKIEVLEIEKAVSKKGEKGEIAGAPTLQVFVMTHCPYGTQIEKGLLPVYKLMSNKANIKIRFVYYTMHGQQEEDETRRQLCLREEQPDKFWPYLECFLEAGDSANCLEKVNFDSSMLTECMLTKADSYWQEDKELNTIYGVTGSPTIVLDDKVAQPKSRAPEDIKEFLCSAFAKQPPECEQTVSITEPSPGFGFTESGGSGGSCG